MFAYDELDYVPRRAVQPPFHGEIEYTERALNSSAKPPSPNSVSWDHVPDAVKRCIERHWKAACRETGSVPLSLEVFGTSVLAGWQRGRVRREQSIEFEEFVDVADAMCWDDLLLATRCEQGDEAAWRLFHERYQPDLEGVLARRVGTANAESEAAAVLADMALPPAKGTFRTQLGAYEGTGPLWAWLATIGLRRVSKRRKRDPVSMDETAGPVPAKEGPNASALDWGARLRAFALALDKAWADMEPKERMALSLRHNQGLNGRQIATALGTSPPTVTRILQRAVVKIRGQVIAALGQDPIQDPGLWTRMESALVSHFEISDGERHRKAE